MNEKQAKEKENRDLPYFVKINDNSPHVPSKSKLSVRSSHFVLFQVYCHNMMTSSPSAYITLSADSANYAHIYGRRLRQGIPQQHCDGELREQQWAYMGVTWFSKVRLDVEKMMLVQDDFTFSSSFGRRVRLGWAGDCYARTADCPKGSFVVDLTGSGVQLAGTVSWYTRGKSVVARVFQESNRLRIHGSCGGWCGQCRLRKIFVQPVRC